MDGKKPSSQGNRLKPFEISQYLENLQGVCWWCSAPADSREHRYKKTDLERLWDANDNPIWFSGERNKKIRSIKSKSPGIRFGKVLCQVCNNSRSQPFDFAYQRFSNALIEGMDNWWRSPVIDLPKLYGNMWESEALNLARYYVKSFGCHMADKGVRPPKAMARFLDGGTTLPDISLCLIRSESHYYGHRAIRSLGPNASLWFPPTQVWVSPSEKRFTGFQGSALIGYVGATLVWQEESGSPESFFMHAYPKFELYQAARGFRLKFELAKMRNNIGQWINYSRDM